MEAKKVSIVLPVYNGEKYLKFSIESVLQQTYKNLELIIVNDCSTDSTRKIVEQYLLHDSRVKLIDNAVNLKLPKSLNAGFSVASGDYYAWTSDDNIFRKNAIEKMVEELENHTEYVMVYSNYTELDAEGNEGQQIHLLNPEKLYIGNVIGACFLYRSDIAKEVGEYDSNTFLTEDYDYWIRIKKHGKLLHIEDDLYLYRVHGGSLSATKKNQIKEQTFRMLEKHFFYLYTTVGKREKNEFLDYFVKMSPNSGETEKLISRIDKKYSIRKKIRPLKDFVYKFMFERTEK